MKIINTFYKLCEVTILRYIKKLYKSKVKGHKILRLFNNSLRSAQVIEIPKYFTVFSPRFIRHPKENNKSIL